MKTVAFFNNKGGVGKTSLVYHLAWMFSIKKVPTLAVDLDPQANLTAMFLDEDTLESLWPEDGSSKTIYGAIEPILRGVGDIATPSLQSINSHLNLVPGDLDLSRFEDKLSDAWPRCHNRDESAFRTMTAFHRLIENAACDRAELVLIDVGPNLGAINRSALIAADSVCIPLACDLFSLQGLRNLGPTLRAWRETWAELLPKAPPGLSLPRGTMNPIGYIVMQHSTRGNRPVKAYQRWVDRIPGVYRKAVLDDSAGTVLDATNDPCKLALLKHYHSLMPLAMDARKPIFSLTPADGAIGAHIEAVWACHRDFYALARKIAEKIDVALG